MVEDGYEFFAKRQLVTLFSAPNYCGEFDNAGAMMSVDETLMCSFQVWCHTTRFPLHFERRLLSRCYVTTWLIVTLSMEDFGNSGVACEIEQIVW